MRYHCMTCGADFDEKPDACPICAQSNFGDRQDSETDVNPPGPGTLPAPEEEETEEDAPPSLGRTRPPLRRRR
jgi:hypothetical protein